MVAFGKGKQDFVPVPVPEKSCLIRPPRPCSSILNNWKSNTKIIENAVLTAKRWKRIAPCVSGVYNTKTLSRETATDIVGLCRRFTATANYISHPTLTHGAICFHRFAVIKAAYSMLYVDFCNYLCKGSSFFEYYSFLFFFRAYYA